MQPALFIIILGLVALPLLEIALLVKVAHVIGFWPTLATVVGTALLGLNVIRQQSFAIFEQAWRAISAGEPPVAPVLDGMFVMLAGMLLVAPGLITDTLGLLLLVPAARRAIAVLLAGELARERARPRQTGGTEAATGTRRGSKHGPVTIEGEFERIDEKPLGPTPPEGKRRDGRDYMP